MKTQEKIMSANQRIRDIQHFGEEGGVTPTIDVAATSTFLKPGDMERVFGGEIKGCYLYSRHSNPTTSAFGKKLAAMEGMPAALGVSSGMAAVNCVIEQWTQSGDHIIAAQTVYGGTYALFKNVLPKRGVQVTWVDIEKLEDVKKAIRPNTKMIYTETMSNPLLAVSDLPKLSALAKSHSLKLVVDNTFTPLIVTPGIHGADAIIYSCTKYISGASDLIAGAVVGSQELIDSLIDVNTGVAMLTGPVMDARVAHELYMRLDHLPLRIKEHSRIALSFARRMEKEKIPVIYPGLEKCSGFAPLKTMMHADYGFGGMLVVDCGSSEKALELAEKLQNDQFGLYAVSLGFSRTLMTCPSISTSSEIPAAEQKTMGLLPGLLRLSIGFVGDEETMWNRFFKCYRAVL
jgi:methionine-gamma-lyase